MILSEQKKIIDDQSQLLAQKHNEEFVNSILSKKPKNYQQRNYVYYLLALRASYVLQSISIIAGGYLMFDVFKFLWDLKMTDLVGIVCFMGCLLLMVVVEYLKRIVSESIEEHKLTTQSLRKSAQSYFWQEGEVLSAKLGILVFLCVITIGLGTAGAYLFVKNNAPKALIVEAKENISPIALQIESERKSLQESKSLRRVLSDKKLQELSDNDNYTFWANKKIILPEASQRIKQYDTQIAELTTEIGKHQKIVDKYQKSITDLESKIEIENQELIYLNNLSKEAYAGSVCFVWLLFEILLVYTLRFPLGVYQYGIKKEYLFRQLKKANKDEGLAEKKVSPSPTLKKSYSKTDEIRTQKQAEKPKHKVIVREDFDIHNQKPFPKDLPYTEVEIEELRQDDKQSETVHKEQKISKKMGFDFPNRQCIDSLRQPFSVSVDNPIDSSIDSILSVWLDSETVEKLRKNLLAGQSIRSCLQSIDKPEVKKHHVEKLRAELKQKGLL